MSKITTFVKEVPQPEGEPRCFSFMYRIGNGKKSYRYDAPARLAAPLQHYHCGMTVGGGWYHEPSHVSPVESSISVHGFFSDGRLKVRIGGGYPLLQVSEVKDIDLSGIELSGDALACWEAIYGN